MERRSNYFLVGVFILVTAAAIFGFTMWVKGPNRDVTYDLYTIYFKESVNGLSKGGSIKYRGVQVGLVDDIRIDPKDSTRIVIRAKLREDAPVHEGTIATLKYQGLTGAVYIELSNVRQEAPRLRREKGERYPVIPSVTSDFQKVVSNASDTIANINLVAERAKLLFSDENIKAFSESIENLRHATDVLARNDERLEQLIVDSSKAMQAIAELSAQMNIIVRETRPGITEGVSETNRLLGESRSTVRNIDSLTQDLKENPSRILFPPQYKGRPID